MGTTFQKASISELLRFTAVHQRHSDAWARATGENFNIFETLGIGHLEVMTHSRFIGELLNPKGSHGQGSQFLKLFLAKVGVNDFETENATVETEYPIGPVTDTSGGRIDILIRGGERQILIENKIYASDQEKQIQRYHNFDPKAPLFYLTLNGRNPDGFSDDDVKRRNCRCISYANEVLNWLKECRKAAACLPVIRETIAQYIHLIEELTNQSTTIRMNKELIDEIVGSETYLAAFFKLCEARRSVEDTLIAKFNDALPAIAAAAGLDLIRQDTSRERGSGFDFKTPALETKNLRMGFEFETGDFRNFYFGFSWINPAAPNPDLAEKLQAIFAAHFSNPGMPTNPCPAWAYWQPRKDWTHEDFQLLHSGQFETNIKVTLERLKTVANDLCPN